MMAKRKHSLNDRRSSNIYAIKVIQTASDVEKSFSPHMNLLVYVDCVNTSLLQCCISTQSCLKS